MRIPRQFSTPNDDAAAQSRALHYGGGERAFVRRLAEFFGAQPGPRPSGVPFGNDMAGIPGVARLAWTTDVLLEGVHFQSDRHTWYAIGRKAMAVNLSDCAAMAATPLGALCAVTASEPMSTADLLELHRGAHELGLQYGCPIVGGNTSSWKSPAVVAITVIGDLGAPPPVLRSGARPDDTIWVSGRLGGSILGRHLWFEPRVAEAIEIRRRLRPSAMMDISDGLIIDLSRMLEASGCGAVLEQHALEAAIHPDARQLGIQNQCSPLEHALYDGEDFELLAALPADAPADEASALGLMQIGRITSATGELLMQDGARVREIPVHGWEHLRGEQRR